MILRRVPDDKNIFSDVTWFQFRLLIVEDTKYDKSLDTSLETSFNKGDNIYKPINVSLKFN